MATLTVRLPDDKYQRLKALVRHRHISVNKLMEELSTQALSEFDSEVRFRSLAASECWCWTGPAGEAGQAL